MTGSAVALLVEMTIYELPPGEAVCQYHFHRGDEEHATGDDH